jgi:hypothetical protein
MAPECHSLLKSVCALKNITVSDYVYGLIEADFKCLVSTDTQIRNMFLAADYPTGSKAALLKKQTLNTSYE